MPIDRRLDRVEFAGAGAWNGSAIFPSSTVSFTAQKVRVSDYNDDTPAQRSSTAGAWSGTDLSADATRVVITRTGAVSGNLLGCHFTGQASPRLTGESVLDVTITFANSPLCNLPGASGSGIGVPRPVAGTSRSQRWVAVQTPGRTFGGAFIAIR
jgi:hypothetical protein